MEICDSLQIGDCVPVKHPDATGDTKGLFWPVRMAQAAIRVQDRAGSGGFSEMLHVLGFLFLVEVFCWPNQGPEKRRMAHAN